MIVGLNQLLHVPGGILLQIIKPFCAIAGSGLNQTLKRLNKTSQQDSHQKWEHEAVGV